MPSMIEPDARGLPRRRWLAGALALGVAVGSLGGCASVPPADGEAAADDGTHPPAPEVVPFSSAVPGLPPEGWRPYVLRRDLTRTRYAVVRDGTRRVLHAQAASST